MDDKRMMDLDLDDDFDAAVGDDGRIRCVFSTVETMKVGTGTTTRTHASKIYWFVEDIGDEMFRVRQINTHYVPSGDGKVVPLKDLMDKYVPEIEFYEDNTIPALELLEDHLDDGDNYMSEGKLYSAESSYGKALKMDEGNVRALFSLGLVYLELQDREKAKDMMGDLLGVKATFDGKNQHLFNEFGISLRKSGMYEEAVDYFSHALIYVTDDENLYYNIARSNYERSDWEGCFNALEKLFEINPKLDAAHELINVVLTLANKPWLCEKNGKQAVPSSIVRKIKGLRDEQAEIDSEKITASSELIRFSYDEADQAETGRARSGGPGAPSSGGDSGGLQFDLD